MASSEVGSHDHLEVPQRRVAPVRAARAARDAVAAFVESFDPAVVSAREAVELVEVFASIEHLASAGLAQAANRVAGTDLWRRDGSASAAAWLAGRLGTTTGQAVGLLKVGRAVEDAPDTLDALRKGMVSTDQAAPIAQVEKIAPGEAAQLLEKATSSPTSVPEIRHEAAQILNSTSGETEADKRARWRKSRYLRTGTTFEGMGWGRWELPPLEHAEVMAFIDQRVERLFHRARRAGQHEPREAYAADALHQLAQLGHHSRRAPSNSLDDGGIADAACNAGEPRSGSGPNPTTGSDLPVEGTTVIDHTLDDRWEQAKVIVKVDLAALLRGEVLPGELCEIAGQGPSPSTTPGR